MMHRDFALLKAIELTGSSVRLAKALGLSPQAVSQWDRVPVYRVIAVEKVSGVPRHVLRPDIYPREDRA